MIGNQLGSFAAGEDIEELASDVFVALWQAGRTLQTEHLRGWLGRVARNQAISFLRKQRLQLVPDEDYLLVDERDAQKLLEAQERSDLLRRFSPRKSTYSGLSSRPSLQCSFVQARAFS